MLIADNDDVATTVIARIIPLKDFNIFMSLLFLVQNYAFFAKPQKISFTLYCNVENNP